MKYLKDKKGEHLSKNYYKDKQIKLVKLWTLPQLYHTNMIRSS